MSLKKNSQGKKGSPDRVNVRFKRDGHERIQISLTKKHRKFNRKIKMKQHGILQ